MSRLPGSVEIGLGTLQRIWNHPENEGRRARRTATWLGWQAYERTVRRPVTARLPGGARVRCHPHDPIASAVLYYGLADPEEMHLTRLLPRAGETFLDVGANIGVYSLLATETEGVRAVAFEPSTLAGQRLDENIELNGVADRVEHDRRAVGARSGSVAMTTDLYAMNRVVPVGSLDDERRAEVPMTTLDDWLAEHPDACPSLVKIDVEGHELEVLSGAQRLIEEHSPVLIVEVNDPRGLRRALDELGYSPFGLDVASRRPTLTTVGAHVAGNVMAARDLDAVTSRLG